MPATESTWRNQALLHRVFAVSGLVLTVATVWMFYKDHSRPWKQNQVVALNVEEKYNQWRQEEFKTTEAVYRHDRLMGEWIRVSSLPVDKSRVDAFIAEVKAKNPSFTGAAINARLDAFHAAASIAKQPREAAEKARQAAEKQASDLPLARAAREAEAAALQAEMAARNAFSQFVAALQKEASAAKIKEENRAADLKRKNGELDAAKADLDLAIRDNKPLPPFQKKVDAVTEARDAIKKEVEDFVRHRKTLDKLVKQITAEVDAARKQLDDNDANLNRLATAYVEKRETYFTDVPPYFLGKKILTLPILDAFGSPRKIANLWSKDLMQNYNFSDVRRFDRCTTCHQLMDKSLPGEPTAAAFAQEEFLDLVLTPPSQENFPKPQLDANGNESPLTIEEVYGLRLAAEGLIDTGDVVVKFVKAKSPAARATLAGDASAQVSGEQLRVQVAEYAGVEKPAEVLFPKTAGLMLGDVIVAINGAELFGGSRDPKRVAADLLGRASDGKPIQVRVRRGLPNPYTSHPRLDLYISDSSPHKMATFACTVCHEGQGSATDFMWASHTPNSEDDARRWSTQHGWFDNPHWIYPMYPKRFAESTCLKCHHEVVELEPSEKFPDAPAPQVVHGYHLIRKFGCFGCHEVNGFDGPVKRVGPDLRAEPSFFAVAQDFLYRWQPRHDELQAIVAKKQDQKVGESGQTVAQLEQELQAILKQQAQLADEKAKLLTSTAADKDNLLAENTAADEKLKASAEELIAQMSLVRAELAPLESQLDKLNAAKSLAERLVARPDEDNIRRTLKQSIEEDASLVELLAQFKAVAATLEKQPRELSALASAKELLARIGQVMGGLDEHRRLLDAMQESAAKLNDPKVSPEDVKSLSTEIGASAKSLASLLPTMQPALGPESHRLANLLKDVEAPGSLRKAGPSLRYLGKKTDNQFLYDWLKDPRKFRDSTRMPKFFGLHDHLAGNPANVAKTAELEQVEIRGIMEYLLSYQQDLEPLPHPAGIAASSDEEKIARGKEQFETRGCLACHTHKEFPDVSKFRRAEDIVQGPDLSAVGDKFAKDRNPQGPQWLYSWIKEPTRYHARTVMPNLFLEPQDVVDPADAEKKQTKRVDPADDIVSYLLSSASRGDWQPAAEAKNAVNQDSLKELALEYLREVSDQNLARKRYDEGISPSLTGELKGAEKELIVATGKQLTDEQRLRYIGRKTISKYGCFGCHDIPGFEDAKPIGTGLADWGRKDPSKLAFEHITHYLHQHGPAAHGAAASHGAAAHGAGHADASESGELKHFYEHQLEAGSRTGFIYQKLKEPRSYDYEKTENKKYSERLRMPQFPFSAADREAVITFVLGLVAEPPKEKYLFKPNPRSAALIAGKQVLEKYNCGGCHILEVERWKLAYAPGDFGPQRLESEPFPFLAAHVSPKELNAEGTPDFRNLLYSTLRGLPAVLTDDGLPRIADEEGSPLDPKTAYSPRAVKLPLDLYDATILDGDAYVTGQSAINVSAKNVTNRYAAIGGVLTRYLVPRVTALDKAELGKARGTEAMGWLPPPLIGEGKKVQPSWLHDFLLDPYPIRPAVYLRMPRFNMTSGEATALVNYFAAADNANYPYELNPEKQPSRLEALEKEYRRRTGASGDKASGKAGAKDDKKDAAAGNSARFDATMKIVLSSNYCVQCHSVRDFAPKGHKRGLAPNLADVHRRLRPEYTRSWIGNPKMILPYTPMPVNIKYNSKGYLKGAVSQDLYHGTSEEQLDALVDLLMNFDSYAKDKTRISDLAPAVKEPPPAGDDAPPTKEPAKESAKETPKKK